MSVFKDESLMSLTDAQKLEDFEYLYKIISENYPFLEVNKRLNGVDWFANREKYIYQIQRGSFESVIASIIKNLNNGHTSLLDKEEVAFYRMAYGKVKKGGELARYIR